MTFEKDEPDLGAVLLSFYECLTDSEQLDPMMEMLTSWLDDGGGRVVSPQLNYHAEKAWRLLGHISTPEYQDLDNTPSISQSHFSSQAEAEEAILDELSSDDLAALRDWFSSKSRLESLLLRVFQKGSTELVILSENPSGDGFILKRTGGEFQSTISKFVADSFDLTRAEFNLVEELLVGGTLREISDRLGKSWETTRSQVKSLANKLGVSSQGDILRIVNQAATLMPSQEKQKNGVQLGAVKTLSRPDGRIICYEIDGPRSDKTLIYLHGLIEGRHWPKKARKLAMQRGWQIIRISRAGRGMSSLNLKVKEAILQDHVDDVMAIVDHEQIRSFSIFGAADGFPVGYSLALQNPDRVQKIIGLEVTPPILSSEAISGFSGKMKTFGLACLYAPKAIKFVLGIALNKMEKMENRYSNIHPLLGVRLDEFEDADGLQAVEANFQDLMKHKSEGLWRDASTTGMDWAHAHENANTRPPAALIHCGNSLINSSDFLSGFAQRIGAPIYKIDSYLPYVTGPLPTVLDLLEQPQNS